MKTIVCCLAIVLWVTGCALEPKQSGEEKTTSITISGSAFHPGTAQVVAGQVVTFTNQDASEHRVHWTSVPGGITSLDSNNLGQRSTFSYTAAVVGTYQYQCGIHPGMKGSLVATQRYP